MLSVRGADSAGAGSGPLERQFRETVQPFVQTYCASCHSGEKPKGDLDLGRFTTMELVAKDQQRWGLVLERLREGEMPPQKAKEHPTPEQRRQIVDWIETMREFEVQRNAGDPGTVLARRLSNSEYDYTIRDLTGVDIRPAKDFPVDPANLAGFDNTGESLTMSPALLKKYLEAARRVADHAVLKMDGIAFAPHPVVADTDRDKYCVNQIISFYKRQKTDYADYFEAAWRFKHRAALGKPNATLTNFAAEAGLSERYLAIIWTTLEEMNVGAASAAVTGDRTAAKAAPTSSKVEIGPTAALRAMLEELPANAQQKDIRANCERMRDFVVKIREKLVPEVKNLTAPKVHNGSQTMVMWKNRQFSANRRRYAGGALELKETGLPPGSKAAQFMAIPTEPAAREQYEAMFTAFCSTFPDAFFVSERARVYIDAEKEKAAGRTGRLLNAGFHSQGGYYRDDGPLYELMLDEPQKRELDRLWKELDFVTGAPMRQYSGFLWFDRTDSNYMRDPEFDPFRPEDKDAASEKKIQQLAEIYSAKTRRLGANDVALQAIKDYFRDINTVIRWVEQARVAAEPSHLRAVQAFAERAYRRPLSPKEREGIVKFYHSLRDENGLGHEDAVRDTIVGVLMSPHFCYRVDLPGRAEGPVRPLGDYALASRLSYFLWASMPDQDLLDHAAAGDLHNPGVLKAQARRMLHDSRVRGFVTEFAGNWLDFRRFEEHNAVDRERFKSFDNDLRQAMFEEPIRFFAHVVSEDRPVLDFLYADYTFVNTSLARHYGMPQPAGGPDQWMKVNANRYGRGGLLPMAVFLTKNAPGLRTSPVKRGYWVARRVLGEYIPPPPPTVPLLPSDEAKLGELSLRDALVRHRADKTCATCHAKFDSFGLVFEGYGPIGELRDKDLAGHAVDTRATFPGGAEGSGLPGLRAYIRDHRQDQFVDNLCRKLLAYALGRTLLLSDELTVRQMRESLAKNGYRFSGLIDTIVSSPQFGSKRGEAQASQEGAP
ncbi:MAG TPA: DUF1592 domain-containing protein [Tepidisphaeraceae bacterium]|nr:DUF1592 domain-containing protein [Tepidisphaeraceae bacterium]